MTENEDLIHCSKCGNKMERTKRRCPNCKTFNTTLNLKGLWWKILLLILFLGITSFLFKTPRPEKTECDPTQESCKTHDIAEAFSNTFLTENIIPNCDEPASLENVQSVASGVIEIFDPIEIPSNFYDVRRKNVRPIYSENLKICIANVFTSSGNTTIEYKTYIKKGISGEQLYIEVEPIPYWKYENTKEALDKLPQHQNSNNNKQASKSSSDINSPTEEQEQEIANRYIDLFNSCDEKAATNEEKIHCIKENYQQWDHQLNVIYSNLKSTLPENEFNTLKTIQRDWIKNKNNRCPTAQVSSTEDIKSNLECLRNVTALRTLELENILEESKHN